MTEQNPTPPPVPADTADPAAPAQDPSPREAGLVAKLRATPLPLFATVMGTAGLSTAWRRAEGVLGTPAIIADILFVVAAAVYVLLLIAYGIRTTTRGALIADALHPMKSAFLSSVTVSLLVLAAAGLPVLPVPVSNVIWWIGAVGHILLMVVTMRIWMRPDINLRHVTPAWFIPVVGNVVAPLAGVPLGNVGMSMFSFSTGLVMWVGLFPIVLFRLFLHDHRLPVPMRPTVLILIAPLAVSSLAAMLLFSSPLTGNSLLAWGLFHAAGAFLLLCVAMLPAISEAPFGVPHWAMSFPMAAYASACLVFAPTFGLFMLAFASILIAWLWAKTIGAIARGGIFVPAPAPVPEVRADAPWDALTPQDGEQGDKS